LSRKTLTSHTSLIHADPRRRDAMIAFPQGVDRKAPLRPQMTAAMLGFHRVFGDCQARDLIGVGFTQAEIDEHARIAGMMAYAVAPEAANDVLFHLSDEAIAAGLQVA
jgi:hypothetical protein